jgi:hypothetical protein
MHPSKNYVKIFYQNAAFPVYDIQARLKNCEN